MKIEIKGLDEAKRKLEKLQKDAEALRGVSFGELFSAEFMNKCSSYDSFNELCEASPFTIETKEDFEAISDTEWDDFIEASTSYGSWQEMLKAAGSAYLQKKSKL